MQKYGITFDDDWDDARIERAMIAGGGRWKDNGVSKGLGLIQHFKNYWSLLWPDDFQNRWTDLILREVLSNQFVGIIGPSSSTKTGTMARIALMDWSVFPECTTVLMSSTTLKALRSRVFGETLSLWRKAHERYSWFPGNPVDYLCVLAYDNVEESKIRDVRNGIIGVANESSDGRIQGMSAFFGRKNTRVWTVADEMQFMERSILAAQENLISNGPNLIPNVLRDKNGVPLKSSRGDVLAQPGYKAVFIGNPNPSRPENALHTICEPEGGWTSIALDGKTKVWNCRKVPDSVVKAVCVNLDGADSPNNDPETYERWVNMIGPRRLAMYTENSESYWTQGRGVVVLGLVAQKVITLDLCRNYNAFDKAIWDAEFPITRVGGLDAAYSGWSGDRCVTGFAEFGRCIDGKWRIMFYPWINVPVEVRADMSPEDQIALFCRSVMEDADVSPENFFFDGRGSLAISIGKLWSPDTNTVEFGGRPTDRIVGPDVFTFDEERQQRRLKLASEHYLNFVTELWWSARYAIESDQVRGMTLDVVQDAQPREWEKVRSDLIQIEPKKQMKRRTGISPDLADWFCIVLEGARRRGFEIAALSTPSKIKNKPSELEKESNAFRELIASRQLQTM